VLLFGCRPGWDGLRAAVPSALRRCTWRVFRLLCIQRKRLILNLLEQPAPGRWFRTSVPRGDFGSRLKTVIATDDSVWGLIIPQACLGVTKRLLGFRGGCLILVLLGQDSRGRVLFEKMSPKMTVCPGRPNNSVLLRLLSRLSLCDFICHGDFNLVIRRKGSPKAFSQL
jgi:hypothetical protein